MEEATYVKGFHNEEAVKKVQYRKLGNTDMRVSKLALGGSSLGNSYEIVGEDAGIQMVIEGLTSGLNYIDTSPWYGNGKSEQVLGKALADVPRIAYYIGTKVGRYEPTVEKMFDFSAPKTLASVDRSLQLLGVDYVDLIQAHDIEFAEDINQVLYETLPALKKVKEQGKARFIGITGYCPDVLQYALENSPVKIDTVLIYARNTLIDKSLVQFVPKFLEAGVGIIDASITSMGLLSSRGPQPWHPAGGDIQQASLQARLLCKEEGVEIADLALQSSLGTSGVHCHLLGCTTPGMLRSTLAVAHRIPTAGETQLARRIYDQWFRPLRNKDWGLRGVEEYRAQLLATQRNQSQ